MSTIVQTRKPGKLSSKYGAAFAAFEKNGTDTNSVPQAFQSMNRYKTKKTTTASPAPASQSKKIVSFSKKADAEKDTKEEDESSSSAVTPTKAPVVKRNFRVSSKLSNRAKLFESGGSSNSTTDKQQTETSTDRSYQHEFQKLRRVGGPKQPLVNNNDKPMLPRKEELTNKKLNSDQLEINNNDDDENEYIEEEIKSDDEDFWEEETVESTNPDDEDGESLDWDEETIEEDLSVASH
eukprot:scaffold5966_cov118-Cylindrotheca_fusiformis.AAC.11